MACVFFREGGETVFVCAEDYWRGDVWADVVDPDDVWKSEESTLYEASLILSDPRSCSYPERTRLPNQHRHSSYLSTSHLSFVVFMRFRADSGHGAKYLYNPQGADAWESTEVVNSYTQLLAGADNEETKSQPRRRLSNTEDNPSRPSKRRRISKRRDEAASSSSNAVIDIVSDSDIEHDVVAHVSSNTTLSNSRSAISTEACKVEATCPTPYSTLRRRISLDTTPQASEPWEDVQTVRNICAGELRTPRSPLRLETDDHMLSDNADTTLQAEQQQSGDLRSANNIFEYSPVRLTNEEFYDPSAVTNNEQWWADEIISSHRLTATQLSPTAPAPSGRALDVIENAWLIDTPDADRHFREEDTQSYDAGGSESASFNSNLEAQHIENASARICTAEQCVSTDENWVMPGKRFGTTGVILSLRELRNDAGSSTDEALEPEMVVAAKSPLQSASDIVGEILTRQWEVPLQNCPGILSLLSVAQYLLTDPTITPSCITANHHLLCFLLMGSNRDDFRSHDGELYICGPDLVYVCTKNPDVFGSLQSGFLSALEGLFLEMAIMEVHVNPASVRLRINQLLSAQSPDPEGCVLEHCHTVLRRNWDYSKVSTKGKAYSAHAGGKLADIVSKIRRFLTIDLARGSAADVWGMFAKTCQTRKGQCNGFSFEDYYVDKTWTIAARSRSNNCYTKFNYKFHPQDGDCMENMSVVCHLRELDVFVESAFYKNEAWLFYSLCTMLLALNDVLTEKIFYICGSGEDSKGLVSLLESGVMGEDNSATLDPSVFSSEEEFRKSAHFAVGKKNIVINESRRSNTFLGDLWKRYVVGESCDVRCNFGHTIQAEFLGRKSQQCNFGDLPVIEQHQGGCEDGASTVCNSVYRRILGFFAGKAILTRDPALVNPAAGIFLKKPGSVMRAYLQHPVTKSLFLTKYLVPFAREYTISDCLALLDAPPPSVIFSTTWVAERLSGVVKGGVPPMPNAKASADVASDIGGKNSALSTLIELHAKWKDLTVIFDYKMHQETLLGPSKKQRPTRFKELVGAAIPGSLHLFSETVARTRKGVMQSTYARTSLDLDKHNSLFIDEIIFAPWEEIQIWTASSAEQVEEITTDIQNVPQPSDLVVDETQELVNISSLDSWLASGQDRRADQLAAYISYVRHRGKFYDGSDYLMSVPQTYRQISSFGRAYCGWLSLQHCTRESRKAALSGLPWKVYELDIANAHPALLMREMRNLVQSADSKFRLLASYCENAAIWRAKIADYYGILESDAKKCLLKVLFGGSVIPEGQSHAIPCVSGLAVEIRAAAECLAADKLYRDIIKMDKVKNARNTTFSALSIYLGHHENEALLGMRQLLVQRGLTPISLTFDGIYFAATNNCILGETISEISDVIKREYAVSLKLKAFDGSIVSLQSPDAQGESLWERICAIAQEDKSRRVVKPYAEWRHMCILTAMRNLFPAHVACFITSHGPMSYETAGHIFGARPRFVPKIQIMRDGTYLVHHQHHAVGVSVMGDIATIYNPNAEYVVTVLSTELLRLAQEVEEVIIFELNVDVADDSATAYVRCSAIEIVAGSLPLTKLESAAPIWAVDSSGAATAEGEAERAIRSRISREVKFIWKELQKDNRVSLVAKGTCATDSSDYDCPCCPFRKFAKKVHLVTHFEKFHLHIDNGTQMQIIRRLAQEIHNAEMSRSILLPGSTFRCNILARSCSQIVAWVGWQPDDIMQSLHTTSDISKTLVILFSGKNGPSYVLKSQLGSAYRLNGQTYFDADFASLLLRCALTSKCKLKGIRDALLAHFAANGCVCLGILLRHTDTYQDLLAAILKFPEFTSLKKSLIEEATRNGEWEVISHDGTYKVMKSLIGNPHGHAGATGSCPATLHTLRGRSGAVPGVSLHRCESAESALATLSAALPTAALATCRFLYSDSPSHFARVGTEGPCQWLRKVLPNIIGIGEDPLHLVFRVESCIGGSRSQFTTLLIRAQKKFGTGNPTYHTMRWSISNCNSGNLWDVNLVSDNRVI